MFKSKEIVEEMDGLKRFACKLTADQADAEDLLQSTVLKALEKKELFKDDTDLFKWSSKIMFNIFVNDYRKKTKFESQYDPEPYIEKLQKTDNQMQEIHTQEVAEAMTDLQDEHQEILKMICLQGLPYKKAARKLDIPIGTVRSRLSRAREDLEARLNSPQVKN